MQRRLLELPKRDELGVKLVCQKCGRVLEKFWADDFYYCPSCHKDGTCYVVYKVRIEKKEVMY